MKSRGYSDSSEGLGYGLAFLILGLFVAVAVSVATPEEEATGRYVVQFSSPLQPEATPRRGEVRVNELPQIGR